MLHCKSLKNPNQHGNFYYESMKQPMIPDNLQYQRLQFQHFLTYIHTHVCGVIVKMIDICKHAIKIATFEFQIYTENVTELWYYFFLENYLICGLPRLKKIETTVKGNARICSIKNVEIQRQSIILIKFYLNYIVILTTVISHWWNYLVQLVCVGMCWSTI